MHPLRIDHHAFRSYTRTGKLFLQVIAGSLYDFAELNTCAALSHLLDGLNRKKNLPTGDALMILLENMAVYMDYIYLEV